MGVILILLIASLTIATGFLVAFIWSVKSGQFDDDYTPSVRMLFDESNPLAGQNGNKQPTKNTSIDGTGTSGAGRKN